MYDDGDDGDDDDDDDDDNDDDDTRILNREVTNLFHVIMFQCRDN